VSTITSTELLNETITTYAWAGTAFASASTERVNGSQTRRNLVSNGAPRPGGALTGWGTNAAAAGAASLTATNDSSRPYGVGGFVRATWTTATNSTGGVFYTRDGGFLGGVTYPISVWARANKSQRLALTVVWYNDAGDRIGTSAGPVIEQAGYSWNEFFFLPTAPAGATSLGITLYSVAGSSYANWSVGDFLDVGGLVTARGGFFDGASPGSTFRTYAATRPVHVQGYESAREARTIFHPIIGTSREDVTLLPAGPRSGTLSYLYDTEAAAVEAERMHSVAAVLTLSDSDLSSVRMSYAVEGSITRTLDPQTRAFWVVQVGYREVLK
jgi:hypothetical protein